MIVEFGGFFLIKANFFFKKHKIIDIYRFKHFLNL